MGRDGSLLMHLIAGLDQALLVLLVLLSNHSHHASILCCQVGRR
jgi:hypothetical protein